MATNGTIAAIIPQKGSNPLSFLTTLEGKLPIVDVPQGRSAESMLVDITRMTMLGNAACLGVDYGRHGMDHELTNNVTWVLQTKAIAKVALKEGFTWTELDIELVTPESLKNKQ